MLNFYVVFINSGRRGERAVLLLPGLVSLSVFPSWQIPVLAGSGASNLPLLPVCYSSWKSDLAGGKNQNKPRKTRAKLGCIACNTKAAHQAALLPGIPGFPHSSRSPIPSPARSSPAERCAGLCPAFAKALCEFILISFNPLSALSPFPVCPSLLPFVWRNGSGREQREGQLRP